MEEQPVPPSNTPLAGQPVDYSGMITEEVFARLKPSIKEAMRPYVIPNKNKEFISMPPQTISGQYSNQQPQAQVPTESPYRYRLPSPATSNFNSSENKIIYVRRNLTVAELIILFFIACGTVFGLQSGWNLINNMPSIEIKWNK